MGFNPRNMELTHLRIKHLIQELGLKQNEFAENIGKYQSKVSKIVRNESKIDSAVIAKILKRWPTLNPKWLLLGEGEMWHEQVGEKDEASLETKVALLFSRLEILEKKQKNILSRMGDKSHPSDTKATDGDTL